MIIQRIPQLGFTVRPVTVVNQGASNGPRVATATFERARYSSPRFEVWIVAEVDGNRYQDESGVRRRAGRAAVPIGRKAANLIACGDLRPKLWLATQDPPWGRASWRYREKFESYDRVAVGVADFRTDSDGEADLRVPPALITKVASELRALADSLHVAIDDPGFRDVFGGR
jgi:hypothetical protein